MTRGMDADESEIPLTLDLANLLSITAQLQRSPANLLVGFAARPLKSVGPPYIAEPVADEVGVTGVDQHGDAIEDVGHEAVEGLHPVAGQEEVPVHVKVAAIVAVDFDAESFHDFGLVKVLVDPT